MKNINKYFSIFKISFKQEKDTITGIIFKAISFCIMIYIFVQLWSFIYGENGTNHVINGYTLEQMIWYLITTELIYFTARNLFIAQEISNEIKSGSITYKLSKPYNYYLYQITAHMAQSCFLLIFFFPVALVLGFGFVGAIPSFSFVQIIPCFVTIIFAVFMSWSLYAIVGLIAFWTQDSFAFAAILMRLLMLLGLLFPVEFFPTWIQPVIEFSPIYSIMSGPASLVANFSWQLFLNVAISQIAWIVVILGLGLLIYARGRKKVIVNGG